MEETDILVIGSGISALFFAIKTSLKRPDVSITILTKSQAEHTNTRLAQGGIAVVTDRQEDSFESHIEDTAQAGGGAGNREVIEMVVQQAPDRLQELLEWDVSFDKNSDGEWDLGLEGGHSEHRVLHHKDTTGREIQEKLLQQVQHYPNVELKENIFVFDLLTQVIDDNQRCVGAIYYDKNSAEIDAAVAKTTLLCAGGCGQIFKNTTNPKVATGDGAAMGARVGAEINDIEFVQFHPTAFYDEDRNPNFLISEAVRGFGAHVVNHEGERFLFDDVPDGELGTRDVVSQAIGKELARTGEDHVYMDCRHLDYEDFYNHFPAISDYCREAGVDIQEDLIPIVPVAHYQCGGIAVDINGQTSIENLLAIGECSCTGLHGKNRLASNSLLEATVYAHQSAEYICGGIDALSLPENTQFQHPDISETPNTDLNELRAKLQSVMTSLYLGSSDGEEVANTVLQLRQAVKPLLQNKSVALETLEFKNMLDTASLIINSKLAANRPVQQSQ